MSASLMGPEDQGQRVGKEAKEGGRGEVGRVGGGRESQARFAVNMRDATEITF